MDLKPILCDPTRDVLSQRSAAFSMCTRREYIHSRNCSILGHRNGCIILIGERQVLGCFLTNWEVPALRGVDLTIPWLLLVPRDSQECLKVDFLYTTSRRLDISYEEEDWCSMRGHLRGCSQIIRKIVWPSLTLRDTTLHWNFLERVHGQLRFALTFAPIHLTTTASVQKDVSLGFMESSCICVGLLIKTNKKV